jgi:predicted nucleotidyltransferase
MYFAGGAMTEILKRRNNTRGRIDELKSRLRHAEEIVSEKACVYATGSFGRLESNKFSDLDLFIVGETKKGRGGEAERKLTRLDEICVKADLIESTRNTGIPDFDGDGRYLIYYTIDDLTNTLGKADDDANNTLTARLLLFLESQPLLGASVYEGAIKEVIAAYWRDYEDHKTSFVPAFLANDILRLWRTFCVNYEARTVREPEPLKMKGKIKNYKLKHSRMLTCYSALLYLLAVYKSDSTVSPERAFEMTQTTPLERLEWLHASSSYSSCHAPVQKLLDQYERFLEMTNVQEKDLIAAFMDEGKRIQFAEESNKFGDYMFEAMETLGSDNKLYRLIVV